MATQQQIDPHSLVARIIAELDANPPARELLLRALLADEFLGMPARVARIEDEILPAMQNDIDTLKSDVGRLKGMALETEVAHRATSWFNREFGFLRNRVMHGKAGVFQQYGEEFADSVADSVESGQITVAQAQRLFDTDVIVRCRRPGETEPTWVAMEVAARIDANDIDRAERSAELLRMVFGAEALPVVAGERIDPPDAARAQAAGVACISILE